MQRLISQDGTKDLPYNLVCVILNKTKIECVCQLMDDRILLATYETEERANEVMENLYKSYSDCLISEGGKHYVRNYFKFPKE